MQPVKAGIHLRSERQQDEKANTIQVTTEPRTRAPNRIARDRGLDGTFTSLYSRRGRGTACQDCREAGTGSSGGRGGEMATGAAAGDGAKPPGSGSGPHMPVTNALRSVAVFCEGARRGKGPQGKASASGGHGEVGNHTNGRPGGTRGAGASKRTRQWTHVDVYVLLEDQGGAAEDAIPLGGEQRGRAAHRGEQAKCETMVHRACQTISRLLDLPPRRFPLAPAAQTTRCGHRWVIRFHVLAVSFCRRAPVSTREAVCESKI